MPRQSHVSIVIPFHRTDFLQATIHAVVRQLSPRDQLVFIDDRRDRASFSLDIPWRNVDVMHGPRRNVAGARNAGIAASRGDYIAFLDADDLPGEHWLAAFRKTARHGGDAIFWGDVAFMDKRGDRMGALWRAGTRTPDQLSTALLFRNPMCLGGSVVSRGILDRVGMLNDELDFCDDYDFWLRAIPQHPVRHVGAVSMYYRRHAENRSNLLRAKHDQEVRLLGGIGDQALQDWLKAWNHEDAWEFLWGKLLYRMDRLQEALRILRRCAQGGPERDFYVGMILLRTGGVAASIPYLESALQMGNAACFNNLAVSIFRDDAARAGRLLATALEMQPGYLDAGRNLLQCERASRPDHLTMMPLREALTPYPGIEEGVPPSSKDATCR